MIQFCCIFLTFSISMKLFPQQIFNKANKVFVSFYITFPKFVMSIVDLFCYQQRFLLFPIFPKFNNFFLKIFFSLILTLICHTNVVMTNGMAKQDFFQILKKSPITIYSLAIWLFYLPPYIQNIITIILCISFFISHWKLFFF